MCDIFFLLISTFEQFNVTHTIHKIRFGEEYVGNTNQLDGEERVVADGYGMYQYYFKVRRVSLLIDSKTEFIRCLTIFIFLSKNSMPNDYSLSVMFSYSLSIQLDCSHVGEI